MSANKTAHVQIPSLHKDEVIPPAQVKHEVYSQSTSMGSYCLAARYYLIRMMGCPVPFLPASVPILGGRTAIELILSAAVIVLGVLITGTSGSTADYICAVTILLSMRYNILTLLFGLSFERAIWWHKVVGVTAILAVGMHSRKGTNTTGIVILSCMCLAAASYFVKPYWFEAFYYPHIVSYLVIIPVIMLHFSAQFFTYACVFWVIDLVLRYVITQHKETMTAEILPGEVIKLKFKKSYGYTPGQYVFLMIPDISRVEWHPFSISSSPNEEYTTFHIRELGDWTKKLGAYIKAKSDELKTESIDIPVYCEGPFGTHQLNLDSSNYEVMILLSGGIGITPLQSLYKDLVKQVREGRHMRKVIFVWSVKDRALVDALHTHHDQNNEDAYLPLSFQPQMLPSPQIRAEGYHARTVAPADVDMEGGSNAVEEIQDLQSSYVFLNEYYLTQVRNEADFDSAGIHPTVQKWLKFGRPNLDELFAKTSAMCKDEGIKRVAVCVCGPQRMVNDVKDLCFQSQLSPNQSTVRFDCHSEVFDF